MLVACVEFQYGIKKREQQAAEGLPGDAAALGSTGRKSKSTDNSADPNGQPSEG